MTLTATQTQVFHDPVLDAQFRRDGYLVTPLLSPEEVQELIEIHNRFTPDVPHDFYSTVFHPDAAHKRAVSAAIDPIFQPKVLSLLAGYKRTISAFITKRGTTTQGKIGMHQDYSFVDQSRCTGVHVWIPLVDVDEENGCLTVYPGTHSLINHISALPAAGQMVYPSPYDPVRSVLEQKCGVLVPMKAGSAIFTNERTLHASEENRKQANRIVVATAYIPEQEPMYLFCPNPQDPNTLDILTVSDCAELVLIPGHRLPYPYSGVLTQVDSREYQFDPLTPEQLKPLYNAEALRAESTPPPIEMPSAGIPASPPPPTNSVPSQVANPKPTPAASAPKGFLGWLKSLWS